MYTINIFWDIFRTFMVVGVIILAHELGHFLAARKVGIKVERFSIGFGPKMIGFKRGETEYCISWFPIFGGYVKMTGENPAEETSKEGEEEKGHFLAAPISHRAIVALAGPGMNMVLAVLAIALAFIVGMPSYLVSTRDTKIGYIEPDSPALKAGIMPNDRIISAAGYKTRVWSDLQENVAMHPDEAIEIVLLRNESQEVKLKVIPERMEEFIFSTTSDFKGGLNNNTIPTDLKAELDSKDISLSPDANILIVERDSKWLITDKDKKYHVRVEKGRLNIYKEIEFGRIGVSPVIKPIIGSVERDSVAAEAGFLPGDVIEAVNHKRIGHVIEFLNELSSISGQAAILTVNRDGDTIEISLPLQFDEDGSLISLGGISFGKIVRLNPISAFRAAIPETIRMGGKIFQFLKRMLIHNVSMKYVAGPIGIVQLTMSVVKTGLAGTLQFTGFLSVNLGIVNLLPLFITDGGLLVFLIIEKLRGKRLSREKQLIIQQIGVGFIILLFLLVTYNDVARLISGAF